MCDESFCQSTNNNNNQFITDWLLLYKLNSILKK